MQGFPCLPHQSTMSREPLNHPVRSVPPVRHAEKRRKSSCRFADRVAQFCVDHYQKHVPTSFREVQKQTCLAAIVALVVTPNETNDDSFALSNSSNENNLVSGSTKNDTTHHRSRLVMLGMGVGTKFLSGEMLENELKISQKLGDNLTANDGTPVGYGRRVRDCHAEVLARRAFCRQLLLEIRQDLDQHSTLTSSSKSDVSVLQREKASDGSIRFKLKPGVSLHMYCSSAPCGNATVRVHQIRLLSLYGQEEKN